MFRRHVLTGALALTAAPALAQAPAGPPSGPPTRIRGTIVSVAGNVMKVKSRDDRVLDVELLPSLTVVSLKKVELSSIKDTDFVGIASRTGADGKMTAIEVLVFPEAMRGTGEGSYPWDLEPGSTMTNGTVKGAVTAANGRELTVAYKDQSNKITVLPNAPVVTFQSADRADLLAGKKIFAVSPANPEGTLKIGRVTVEKDGVPPPM